MVAMTSLAASALPSQPAHLQYRATQVSSLVLGSSRLRYEAAEGPTDCASRSALWQASLQ